MSSGNFSLKAIITAVDKLSPTLRNISRNTRAWSREFEKAGRGAIPMAAGLGAAMLIPARAFMGAEDAATQLQNTLMTRDGLAGGLEELKKISTELGNKLPGTTADFLQMASTMKALGVSTESLIGGSLQAAAYMAVVAKPLGVTYDQAAESIGKLGRAFGISGKEMVPFADTLQRALHMGGDLEQMQYAMSRIAGPLKMLGKQGLGTANEMVPLVALLSQAGLQGEAIGTGIQNMIESLTAKGQYDGVQSLVNYLEQIHKLAPKIQLEKLSDLFGQHATKASIIGAGGYNQTLKDMANQANINQRVANSLKTLTNVWDAATGTFTNAMAAFADKYAPELKKLAEGLNKLSENSQKWIDKNGPMIKTIVELAAGFVGVKLAVLGVGFALAFVSKLMSMTPLGLFLNAMAIAVPLLITYWDKIPALLGGLWDGIIDRWSLKIESFVNFVSDIAASVRSLFSGIGDMIPSSHGMSLPGQSIQRKPIVSNNSFKGSLDINHLNAPQGFRAAPVKSRGAPFRVEQNVGYNWSVTGM